MSLYVFDKPKEVQEIVVKNILAGFAGNIMLPLPFYLMTDIHTKRPELFYPFAIFLSLVAIFHLALGVWFEKTRKFLGDKNWNRAYMITFCLEALNFTPFCIYFMLENGVWSPEFLLSMIIWGIAYESFSRFTTSYIETYLLAAVFLTLPLVSTFAFQGSDGFLMIILITCYIGYTSYSTFLGYGQFRSLVRERKKSQEYTGKLQRFVDLLPAIVAQFNHKLELTMANKKLLRLMKEDHQSLDKVLDPFLINRIRSFIANGEIQTSFEMETSYFTGNDCWFQIRLNLEDEDIVTLLAYDIHDIKLAAQELEIQKEKNINATRLASLGEMAGGIAHEINNPLTIISGQSSMLRRMIERDGLSAEKVLSVTEKINTLVDRIAKTIQGMKNLSREEAEDETQTYHMYQLVDDVVSLCQQKFITQGVQFEIDEVDSSLLVQSHYQHAGQVLINLLNNAFDEIESQKTKYIKLGVSFSDKFVYLDVKDNGPGVANEEKLFQPFFTTKDIGKGMGLGLSLSKKIAQRSGGDLTYFRDADYTVFRFSIPRSKTSELSGQDKADQDKAG